MPYPREIKASNPLNTTENGDKHWLPWATELGKRYSFWGVGAI